MTAARTATVFGASKALPDGADYQQAVDLGKCLAAAGWTVCTGGYKGIMEAVSRGAKESAGRTLGITTAQFPGRVNPWIDEEKSFPTWQERLFGLIEAADAFVICNGGTGTLVEMMVVWEMTSRKMLSKPVVFLGNHMRDVEASLKGLPYVLPADRFFHAATPEEAVQCLQSASASRLPA